MRAVIDGEAIASREALHDALEEQLSLPAWYGRNLDALYDCLTDLREDTELWVIHTAALRERLGGYALGLLRMLRDTEEENPRFHLIVRQEEE